MKRSLLKIYRFRRRLRLFRFIVPLEEWKSKGVKV